MRFSRRSLLLAPLAAACRERAAPAPSPSASAPAGAPRRVVSLAPALTDSLFAIGAGPQVIGISDYCDYPPEATKLPRLGTSLTPDERARLWWDISWIWGPPDDHLAHLFRTIGAERFVYGSQWPMRLTQTPRANLDLLPDDLREARLADAEEIVRTG